MLDGDRERREEDRGRQFGGVESGERRAESGVESIKGEPSARGAGRKRGTDLLRDGQNQRRREYCVGEVVMEERASAGGTG
jgi:hypothetical protein